MLETVEMSRLIVSKFNDQIRALVDRVHVTDRVMSSLSVILVDKWEHC
jgi:hypothetical protein